MRKQLDGSVARCVIASMVVLFCACPVSVECQSDDCRDAGADAGGPTACGTDAELCAESAKNCDVLNVTDRCGNPRAVSCGACGPGAACGAAGVANVCAPHCADVCPAGYACAANGVCEKHNANPLVLDVKTVKVSGSVTVNALALVTGANCSASTGAGSVIFTSADTDTVVGAKVDCTANTFSLELPLGAYRVSLRGLGPAWSNLPQGETVVLSRYVLQQPVADLALNTSPLAVSGAVTLNGQSALTAATCPQGVNEVLGHVAFIETHSQVATTSLLRCTAGGLTFQAALPIGTYQVTVTGVENASVKLPHGTVEAMPALQVAAPRADLVIDVETVDVKGALTLNGQTPSTRDRCLGLPDATATTLFFKSTTTHTAVHRRILCASGAFDFNVALPKGTYQVTASSEEGFSTLPHGNATVAQPLVITAPQDNVLLTFNTVTVSGRLTLNDQEPVVGPSCVSDSEFLPSGYWVLHQGPLETGTAYFHRFSCDSDFSFSLDVPAGTYQVSIVGPGSYLSNLPEGSATLATPLTVSAATSAQTFNLKTVEVSGKVTLNNTTPLRGPQCGSAEVGNGAGIFVFKDTLTGSKLNAAVLCDDADFAFHAQLPPGIYRVSLEGRAGLSNLIDGTVGFPFSLAVP